ncbi:isocitrate dehydrogenase [Candidatus Anaplasma sp. TIGMIC]|uniref:isocitrate dehydrogenase n=1 Tax=Candidatus Anaplasma sp. TIGMIC TaxID=3020713 RepID=UPI00232DC4D6|nr:isocitrate dehydrogenase [Candidatus Anaplasma sp. TIGMIC]MDB1135721.1 isocitrate dehydrogenase [Candidatus Anaplasma sp. TIGMIC]
MSVPITVAYGDGVGPEIMEAVLFVLKEAQTDISVEAVEIGNAQYRRDWPCGIAPSSWASIKRTKVLLKSPTMTPQGGGHKSLNVALRKRLGLYANVRPCVSYFPVVSTVHPNLDIVVVRENEEDTYCGMEYKLSEDAHECVKLTTVTASERLCEYAFNYARNHKRKRVTCLVKDNIMKMTDGTLRNAFHKVAAKYPDIASDYYIVDIGMAKISSQPEEFDVVVTTNLYGDILSDIVSLASGSIGLSGSANLGSDYSMFEAVHGSAPDIAGKNIANPSGLLNAAIQMLVHIGHTNKAQAIHDAFLKTLEDGVHTADIYNPDTSSSRASTTEFARAIAKNLGAVPSNLRRMSIEENPAMVAGTVRPEAKPRTFVGVDVTVHWAHDPTRIEELAKSLSELASSSSAELKMIHAKGMELWPSAPYAFSYIDLLTCRFYLSESQNKDSSLSMGQLLIGIENLGLDIAKATKLYTFDGVPGFFST